MMTSHATRRAFLGGSLAAAALGLAGCSNEPSAETGQPAPAAQPPSKMKLSLSVRNIEGVRVLPSNRIGARDVMNTRRVVLTRAALEKLQDALG